MLTSWLSLVLSTSLGLAADAPLSVGSPALLFSLPAINEDAAMEMVKVPRISLRQFVGVDASVPTRAVVLYFFDRQHGGEDLANLNRVQRRFSSKDVHVIGISTDKGDVGSLSTWLEAQKLSVPVVRDNHKVVSSRYRVDKLPMTVVIDGDGFIFAIGRPPSDELEAAIAAELEPLLAR